MRELLPRCSGSRRQARDAGIGFTIDAEEADRLELSLDLVEALALAPELAGWDGLGLAVQAYQKRALPLIDWLADLARRARPPADGAAGQGRLLGHRDQAGAGARPRRLSGVHPQGRDRRLLPRLRQAAVRRRRPRSIRNSRRTTRIRSPRSSRWPATARDCEFQRLHGMGEALYDEIVGRDKLDRPCRIYAPVGSHEDLLAYLVRRLLENGANTSFVNRIVDEREPIDEIVADPVARLARLPDKPHPRIPLPRDLFQPERRQLAGHRPRRPAQPGRAARAGSRRRRAGRGRAGPIVGGIELTGDGGAGVRSRPTAVAGSGTVVECGAGCGRAGARARRGGGAGWDARPAETRAAVLERAADLYERHRGRADGADHPRGRADDPDGAVGGARGRRFPALLRGPRARRFRRARSAARPDRRAQRARAARARRLRLHLAVEFSAGDLHRPGRGCAGRRQRGDRQAGRADAAGRRRGGAASAARPASRPMCCICCPATARASARALVADPRIAGVAFTGSTETAQAINRALAQRDGPIVPLIAETGGQNAMIVDSSALPEQVVARCR